MKFETKFEIGEHKWYLCGTEYKEGRIGDIQIMSHVGHFYIYYLMPVQGWVEETKLFNTEDDITNYYKQFVSLDTKEKCDKSTKKKGKK